MKAGLISGVRQTAALTADGEREKRDLFILGIGSRHARSAKQDTLSFPYSNSPTLLPQQTPKPPILKIPLP
ncbi:hypothetical protein CEXT_293741 [Caerostris extrusa]|uniref:Uncharacterized protein n=1 Tax=Caerostris extrusa TaxID=172846 RepID=A0AAV4Y8F3_CAEEX|nr:hypothetical protein CEXT_293741 [Caerostris extrusa]